MAMKDSVFAPVAPISPRARKEATKPQSPRDLAARFALTVTERTPNGVSCIAKNGGMSLFSSFHGMVPQVQSPAAISQSSG